MTSMRQMSSDQDSNRMETCLANQLTQKSPLKRGGNTQIDVWGGKARRMPKALLPIDTMVS
ncbi:MAG: hypothetical protein Rhims3KO_02980 [Hyphomicrobiales bacterium]